MDNNRLAEIETRQKAIEQMDAKERAAFVLGLRQAAHDVCPYCGGRYPNWDAAEGPNEAGNWTHTVNGNPHMQQLCKASPIYSRLAFMARPEDEEPEGAIIG